MTPKRRAGISLKIKMEIFRESSALSIHKLAEQYRIDRASVRRILKNSKTIQRAFEQGNGPKRKRIRAEPYHLLEDELVEWIKMQNKNLIPITGEMLRDKAKKIAIRMGFDNFGASDCWLNAFKKRRSLVFKAITGEGGAVDMNALREWQTTILKEAMKGFHPNDIFNLDELGLFWKAMPDKTLTFRGEDCTGGKLSKERITVLVGGNLSGTEKCPLMIIGKSRTPRCFKGQTIPVEYKANSTAWMTRDLFYDYLRRWDDRLEQADHHILVFIDNVVTHHLPVGAMPLRNIILRYLPPNTTSKSQPMDAGVIHSVKAKYRSLLLNLRIESIESNKPFNPNLLDAIRLFMRAWEAVTPQTFRNCFKEAGFVSGLKEIDNMCIEALLKNLEEQFVRLRIDDNVNDYLMIDDLIATSDTNDHDIDSLNNEKEILDWLDDEAQWMFN